MKQQEATTTITTITTLTWSTRVHRTRTTFRKSYHRDAGKVEIDAFLRTRMVSLDCALPTTRSTSSFRRWTARRPPSPVGRSRTEWQESSQDHTGERSSHQRWQILILNRPKRRRPTPSFHHGHNSMLRSISIS
jgi:hypothetical protein